MAAPEPDEHCLREDRIAVVRELVAQVQDETLRTIVTLRYIDPEHTTREIAEQLSIPHGTVCVKLMRFRSAVRGEFVRRLAGMERS